MTRLPAIAHRCVARLVVPAILGVVACAGGCRKVEAPPPRAGVTAASRARAPGGPFTHPPIPGATASPPPADCSQAALSSAIAGLRQVKARTAAAWPSARRAVPTTTCERALAAAWSKQSEGLLLDRTGRCVGRDQPLDPVWDQLNSAIMTVGACLDCGRPAADRAERCRHASEALAHLP
jgi:hypothetical protein